MHIENIGDARPCEASSFYMAPLRINYKGCYIASIGNSLHGEVLAVDSSDVLDHFEVDETSPRRESRGEIRGVHLHDSAPVYSTRLHTNCKENHIVSNGDYPYPLDLMLVLFASVTSI